MIWNLENLFRSAQEVRTRVNGKWVPCRPLQYPYLYGCMKRRLRAAWAVLTGKADAFVWPEGQ